MSVAANGIAHWYLSLRRPPLTLATRSFAVVWTIVDILLGLAAWALWRRLDPWKPSVRPALRLWGWELALIAAWVPIFFGLRAPAAAMGVMAALLGVALATFLAFRRRNGLASVLLLPSLLWLCYAAYLNIGFWWLNAHAG